MSGYELRIYSPSEARLVWTSQHSSTRGCVTQCERILELIEAGRLPSSWLDAFGELTVAVYHDGEAVHLACEPEYRELPTEQT